MIEPIYAHYFFSVISHFGSGHRITVLIFFSSVNPFTIFKQAKSYAAITLRNTVGR